ncbi:hypothetical protein ACIBCL_25165 [Micromonospora zamorensis]|uniref:hypothetical protein n=1 Tax=Micromonospora zamorensis TaxID=709883 RepID=UPI00379C48FB
MPDDVTVDERDLTMPRERLSLLAVIPGDVIDPLLWQLALDVTAAHQPDNHGNCRNLQCTGQRGMCAAARTARRAMNLARPAWPAATSHPPQRTHGRAAAATNRPGGFRGWFASSSTRPVAGALLRQPREPFSSAASAA